MTLTLVNDLQQGKWNVSSNYVDFWEGTEDTELDTVWTLEHSFNIFRISDRTNSIVTRVWMCRVMRNKAA
jgi:hypothetical protein